MLKATFKVPALADVVGNGKEAVEALLRLPYDLVFTDCHMPEMDGFEASRAIRARRRTSATYLSSP